MTVVHKRALLRLQIRPPCRCRHRHAFRCPHLLPLCGVTYHTAPRHVRYRQCAHCYKNHRDAPLHHCYRRLLLPPNFPPAPSKGKRGRSMSLGAHIEESKDVRASPEDHPSDGRLSPASSPQMLTARGEASEWERNDCKDATRRQGCKRLRNTHVHAHACFRPPEPRCIPRFVSEAFAPKRC